MRRSATLAFLVPVLLLASCAHAGPSQAPVTSREPGCATRGPTSFTVTGTIRTENSEVPLYGAIVSVSLRSVRSWPRRTVTGPMGIYRVGGLPPGSYVVEARILGYYTERQRVSFAPRSCGPDTTVLDFHLRAQPVRLHAR